MPRRPVWFAQRPGRSAVAPATREGWMIALAFIGLMILSGLAGLGLALAGWPFWWLAMGAGMFGAGAWFIAMAMRHSDDPRWN
jgi:hypothetical protein